MCKIEIWQELVFIDPAHVDGRVISGAKIMRYLNLLFVGLMLTLSNLRYCRRRPP